jgi:predicted ArsR family transcriptional regulator
MAKKDEVSKILDRPQNVAILKYTSDKDWVTAEEISDALGINITLSMLYISDLEKVGLLLRKLDTVGDEKVFKFKITDKKDNMENLMTKRDSEVPLEKYKEAFNLYIRIYSSLIGKLKEVGGRSMVETIVDKGMEDSARSRATLVVVALEKGEKIDSVITEFSRMIQEGEIGTKDFVNTKLEFIDTLKVLIIALERFMGRLYGQHVTKTSLKPVLMDNEELIHELDLLAGLPKEYFPMGGT